MAYPPGHYYSPLVGPADLRNAVTHSPSSGPASTIDLGAQRQLDLVVRLSEHYADQPFTAGRSAGNRYYFENAFFSYGDALMLHCMLRELRPQRVIEVGSGFSSAVILDTDERFLGRRTSITMIEPFPDRLRQVVGDVEAIGARVLVSRVQDVDPGVFDALGSGDVLFIDSSHVVKLGSDVQLLLLHILPRLRPGVVVHVHDVFHPFGYPKDWDERGLSWNEAYVLQALLTGNPYFEILLYNSYLACEHRQAVASAMPLWARDPGSSIWLRRREGD